MNLCNFNLHKNYLCCRCHISLFSSLKMITFTPNFTFHTGRKVPAIAFGTGTSYFERSNDVTEGIIKAFTAGFRYIDTAIAYQTEEGVGNAIKTLIKVSNTLRECEQVIGIAKHVSDIHISAHI